MEINIIVWETDASHCSLAECVHDIEHYITYLITRTYRVKNCKLFLTLDELSLHYAILVQRKVYTESFPVNMAMLLTS